MILLMNRDRCKWFRFQTLDEARNAVTEIAESSLGSKVLVAAVNELMPHLPISNVTRKKSIFEEIASL